MNIRFAILLLFLLLAIAGKSQVEISLIQPVKDNFIESEIISEITFIPLQYEKIGTISGDMELKVDGNNYFILDNKFTQNVFRYNENGELLNMITTQKQSSQGDKLPVLNNPVKFNINPTLEQVEIFTFENLALNRFTYSGKKIDQIIFPVNPSDFTRDNKGNYWLYTGWNNKESQFRLILTDLNGKIIDKKMRLVSKCTQIVSYAFSSYKNDIFLCELLGNTTYKILDNNLTETFFMNYGIRNLAPTFHSMSAYDSYQMLTKNGYYSLKKYLENDNYAYFFLNFTTESQKELFHIIYDKKNKKTYRYFEDPSMAIDKAQALTEDNELIFLVTPRNIRRLASSESVVLPPVFDEIVAASDSIKNTMIVKIKLANPDDIQSGKEK
jgi:hypothetical protein